MKGGLKNSKEFLRLSKPSPASKASSASPGRHHLASKSAAAAASSSLSSTAAGSGTVPNTLFSSKLCPSLCRPAESEQSVKWYQLPLASRVLSPPVKLLSPELVSQRQAAAAAALEHQANIAKQGIQGSTTDSKWLADVLKKVHTPAPLQKQLLLHSCAHTCLLTRALPVHREL
jgi:hypothetical protein